MEPGKPPATSGNFDRGLDTRTCFIGAADAERYMIRTNVVVCRVDRCDGAEGG